MSVPGKQVSRCPGAGSQRHPEGAEPVARQHLGPEHGHQQSCFVSPGLVQIPVSMYQTVVTSLAQGNGPVQVAMAPVTTRISDSAVTMDGQAVEVVTLEQ